MTEATTTRKVTAGPAAAIRNSAPGVVGSERRSAMPPNIQRLMFEISMPLRRATIAWPSSCRTIEAKNRSADSVASEKALLSWPGPKASL
jgi:hypothetical protein